MTKYYYIILVLFLVNSCSENQETKPKNNTIKADGKELFLTRCITCHGTDGNAGLAGSAKLGESKYNKEQIIATLKNGQKAMPKVDLESEEEYQAVADYVLTLRK